MPSNYNSIGVRSADSKQKSSKHSIEQIGFPSVVNEATGTVITAYPSGAPAP